MKGLYEELMGRWASEERPRRVLKTDLFDEAISEHSLVSLLRDRCEHVVGTDVSLEIARAAGRRMTAAPAPWHVIAVSDARSLGFRSGAFDAVISNSTLDHFPEKGHITESLRELHRVMRPGATLTITLDNPANPIILVRNRLPYRLLRSLGVIPFYMGATLSEPALVRALESSGFRVCESTAIAHAPRVLAIRAGRLLARRGGGRMRDGFLRLLRALERLERLPTKHLTGHYVAVKAERR